MVEKRKGGTSSLDLEQNIAGLLCYLGGWISGIILLILEQKDKFVRFHAAQSIVVFGFLNLVQLIIDQIPLAGRYLVGAVGIVILILWIVLMVKAYHSQSYRLPVAADVADRIIGSEFVAGSEEAQATPGKSQMINEAVSGVPLAATEEKKIVNIETKIAKKSSVAGDSDYFRTTRTERTIASCMTIFWCFVVLIFLVFYNSYIAFYELQKSEDVTTWIAYPFLNAQFNSWLPLIVVTLALAIIGHIIMIILDKYEINEIVNIVLMFLFMGAFVQLLQVFPFNFSVLPTSNMAIVFSSATRIVLLVIILALGISAIVRIVKFAMNLARGEP